MMALKSSFSAILAAGLLMASPLWSAGVEGVDYDLPTTKGLWQMILLLVNLDEVVETVAFYTFLLAGLIILFGGTIASRMYIWGGYTFLATFALIWIALNDQNESGIYWSGFEVGPEGLLIVGYLMASANLVFAALSIKRNHPAQIATLPLLVLALAIWGLWWTGRSLATEKAFLIFYGVGLTSGLSHLIPILTFTKLDGSPDRKLHWTALAGFLFLTLGTIAVSMGQRGYSIDTIFVNRAILLGLIGFLVLFFIRHVRAIRLDRETVIARSIEDALREAETNKALLNTQLAYADTLEVARVRQARLATASHDIRQPIMSLRSSMTALTHKQPAAIKEQLGSAFDYLDQLAASYMEEDAGVAPEDATGDGDRDNDGGLEPISTVMLSATLERMFKEEAEAAGHSFVLETEEAEVRARPLELMRILSNLISNAIKHARTGEIRLAITATDRGADFTVSNLGVLPEGDIFQSGEKGESSSGRGLGLAIVDQLARNNGFDLSYTSNETSGTSFTLKV